MKLRFSKMHGLGNDFMVIDAINQSVDSAALNIKTLADRRFGVGFDQLLLVEKSDQPELDFRYRIFNANGSEVEQCGNGARCFARFVKHEKLSEKNPIKVETLGGIISLEITSDEQVRVDMGCPVFEAKAIPVSGNLDDKNQLHINIDDYEDTLLASVISMGNPHAVITVDDFNDADIYQLGFALQSHGAFPEQVNVGFMQIIDRNTINLRVFERGVGETLACGTGACAAVVAGIIKGKLDSCVNVSLPGGNLRIEWQGNKDGNNASVFMEGDATLVYSGEIEL